MNNKRIYRIMLHRHSQGRKPIDSEHQNALALQINEQDQCESENFKIVKCIKR